MQASHDIVDDMKLIDYMRKIVFDSETNELQALEDAHETKLVCVLCGEPWEPSVKNRCECGGFCTWGESKGAQPLSWNEDGNPKAPPKGTV